MVFFYRVFKLKHGSSELTEDFLYDLWKGKEMLIEEYRTEVAKRGLHLSAADYEGIVERTETNLNKKTTSLSPTPSETSSEIESDEKWESLSLPNDDTNGEIHKLANGQPNGGITRKRSHTSEQNALRFTNHFLPINHVSFVSQSWMKVCLIHAFYLCVFYILFFVCSFPSSLSQLLVPAH